MNQALTIRYGKAFSRPNAANSAISNVERVMSRGDLTIVQKYELLSSDETTFKFTRGARDISTYHAMVMDAFRAADRLGELAEHFRKEREAAQAMSYRDFLEPMPSGPTQVTPNYDVRTSTANQAGFDPKMAAELDALNQQEFEGQTGFEQAQKIAADAEKKVDKRLRAKPIETGMQLSTVSKLMRSLFPEFSLEHCQQVASRGLNADPQLTIADSDMWRATLDAYRARNYPIAD